MAGPLWEPDRLYHCGGKAGNRTGRGSSPAKFAPRGTANHTNGEDRDREFLPQMTQIHTDLKRGWRMRGPAHRAGGWGRPLRCGRKARSLAPQLRGRPPGLGHCLSKAERSAFTRLLDVGMSSGRRLAWDLRGGEGLRGEG